ncbi:MULTISPECIES: heavy metal translocating P-type ATPase [unclassified Corynebacterium]|uniref:heavy metal translocating P-type ATPase n=1 Tax=unclassified Corynebacterium TaxID=2624378 RepID=UPI0029CA9161|nr:MULTISPECIES: HAD family hydrolase [unclassified Corynebacterium]WPF66399.1 HAD family hydrolase [Corynebacterium sp. 22KM0430]WPF68889.1 HAD family hydrolase [Corynebacterium sp. 21KM1197]
MADEVAQAINQAKEAAAEAGFGDPQALGESGRKISLSFDLVGLTDAPEIAQIERALGEIPGVRARIVYHSAMAWITAPEGLVPNQIVEVCARFGVQAVLTDDALRRQSLYRAEDVAPGQVPRRLPRGKHGRRRAEAERRDLERARAAGFFHPDSVWPTPEPGAAREPRGAEKRAGDVLYTARDLITTPRLIVALLLTLPVVALSYIPQAQFPGWQWACALLSIPVVSWCAWPFHRALAGGVRRGAVALDGASSLAILAAFAWSVGTLLFTEAGSLGWRGTPDVFALTAQRFNEAELFFDVACGTTLLLLIGRKLSIQARSSLLDDLAAQRVEPQSQVVLVSHNRATGKPVMEEVSVSEINVGDDILVQPGQRIPVDGVVIGGSGTVRPGVVETVLPTSSGLVPVEVDSPVRAGAINVGQRIKVRVQRTGHRTRIAGVERWISGVNALQNTAVMLSTRSARLLIPAAVSVAVLSFAGWVLGTGNPALAFGTALAVLACVAPAALALSSALALRLGVETAARHGMLLREGAVMRRLQGVDTVIFNRVGALSHSDMTVETVTADVGENPDLVLRVAAALCLESEHTASRAIVHAARQARDHDSGGDIPHWIDVNHAHIDEDGTFHAQIDLPVRDAHGQHSRQVSASLWRPHNLSELSGRLADAAFSGGTPLVVRWNGRDRGVISLHDTVREDAAEAVAQLESMGLETMMLTRDAYPVGRRFARRLGISQVLAGISAGRKPYAVRGVHNRGARVAMVGDSSVSECLKVADVGVLIDAEAQLDKASRSESTGADVVLLRRDVSAIAQLMGLARKVCTVVDRNILFAWAYNAVAVVASVAGLLHPMAATVLMLAASLVIEARSNSVRKYPAA